MGSVEGVGGPGGGKVDPAKAKGKTGAFKAVQQKPPAPAPASQPTAPKKSAGYRVANPEPARVVEGPPPAVRPEIAAFAQGMVQAADAAAMPGPTTDSDLLPRESVSGLFVKDFALQGAVALGRPPLGEDEAARIVIEKHIAGQQGLYYDAKVQPDGDANFIVRLHRLDSKPPFLPNPKAEVSYRIDRRTWAIEKA
jgi:hypothetical protein